WLSQLETQPPFCCKAYVLFSRRIGRSRAGSCADQSAYGCAFSSASQCSYQSSASSTAANKGQIAFPVRPSAYEHAIGLQRHGFPVHGNRRERDAEIACIVKAS